ncbi:MAG: TonB-dependent receptor [Salinivirgaceae bacterium]|nr:TonB-dependent receptor [Salinivirgaceae bacterium]
MRQIAAFLIFTFFSFASVAQSTGSITGRITDIDNYPIEMVNIAVENNQTGTTSEFTGKYKVQIPANEPVTIHYSSIGFQKKTITVTLKPGERKRVDVQLEMTAEKLEEVEIAAERERHSTTYFLDPRTISQLPQVSGSVEAIIKTMPGVSSNNELSNQYSVRGGNYDENLIYVNGVEIYRPFLVRSGQQEGFSFLNPEMVANLAFSAGGFEAEYGDKMSSVLNIEYKKPTSWGGSFKAGLMEGALTVHGSNKNHRLTHITSVRYKKSGYILNTLETKGDYNPTFSDLQTFITYDLTEKLEIGFIGNYNNNTFQFKPVDRETEFGLVNNALRLKVYFEGQEIDEFITSQGAFLLNFKPTKKLRLNISASAFTSSESETFDILGEYWLNQVDTNMGSSTFGDSVGSLAVGSYLDHARNYLDALVYNIAHKGEYKTGNHHIKWGAKWQVEDIKDEINEWMMLDSAGYSLPPSGEVMDVFTDSTTTLFESRKFSNSIYSNRLSAYIQNTWKTTIDSTKLFINGGLRVQYWDFNNQFIVSPRLLLAIQPDWKKDWLFRISGGSYYQPPFYKEVFDKQGNKNKDIKAQESYHIVAGADYNFMAWRRPFKFISEIYYKKLENIIPYSVNNLQILYEGENSASGYTTGLDMKLTGQFVKGVDSWISVSLMKAQEDIKNDMYFITNADGSQTKVEPGYIDRPTDQRVTVNLFFQDYIPGNPTWKVHLNLVYGSGLSFGPPNSPRYMATGRMPDYRRVDIGMSKSLISSERTYDNPKGPTKWFKDLWIGLEVFNMFDINNTISYTWIRDVYNNEYAIPNYLTGRLFNLKITGTF